MKKLTFLIAILIAFCSCTQQAEAPVKEVDETGKQNVELIKKFIASIEAENLEPIKEIFDTSMVNLGPGFKDELKYEKAIESYVSWFESTDSIKIDVISILHESTDKEDLAGDWVMVWCNVSMYNVKAEAKVKVPYHFVTRIENGKVVTMVDYFDRFSMYKQMGAELKWLEKEKEE